MVWSLVGSAEIGPGTDRVVLGPIQAPQDRDLLLKVVTPSYVPIHTGYCLLWFGSSWGRELGAIRVWPRREPTVYVLGPGLRVRDPFGELVLEQRTWSVRWLRAGFLLSVSVLADLPDPALPDTFTPPAIAGPDGSDLFTTPAGDAGRLTFPL